MTDEIGDSGENDSEFGSTGLASRSAGLVSSAVPLGRPMTNGSSDNTTADACTGVNNNGQRSNMTRL